MTQEKIFKRFQKISVKASLFVLLLLFSTSLIFYLIASQIMGSRIMNEIITRVEGLSRSIASTAGYSLLSEDLLGLDSIVFGIKSSNPDIDSIAILSEEGKIRVHSDVQKTGEAFVSNRGKLRKQGATGTVIREVESPSGSYFQVSTPIVFMEKHLGSVVLNVNKSTLLATRKEARQKIAYALAVILLLGTASTLILSSFLTRPIQELALGVAELKAGKRTRPLRVYSRDELGRLTESFNEMTALITAQQDKLSRYAHELEEAYVATVRVLAAAIDARDTYTLGHSTRVAQLAVMMGRRMGLSQSELEDLEIACLFHDVGKIKIPDAILLKKEPLETGEKREMNRHPEYGAEILSKASSLLKYIPAIKHHHEWYDGTGYPDGLRQNRIPLPAAIISLADAYDAMTSDRPYRQALSKEEAARTIQSLAGRQFNPALVNVFVEVLADMRAHGETG